MLQIDNNAYRLHNVLTSRGGLKFASYFLFCKSFIMEPTVGNRNSKPSFISLWGITLQFCSKRL